MIRLSKADVSGYGAMRSARLKSLGKAQRMKLFNQYWEEDMQKHLRRHGFLLRKDAVLIRNRAMKKAGL